MTRLSILSAVLALTSCNLVQPEIRIGPAQGIPTLNGSAEANNIQDEYTNALPELRAPKASISEYAAMVTAITSAHSVARRGASRLAPTATTPLLTSTMPTA